MDTMMIPTVQLIVEFEAKLNDCPPRMTVSDMNPINCKQFRNPQMSAGQYPSA